MCIVSGCAIGLMASIVWDAYMSWRCRWVRYQRMRVIGRNLQMYYLLPSFEDMVEKYWWIWDIYDFPLNLPKRTHPSVKNKP